MIIGWLIHDLLTTKQYVPDGSIIVSPISSVNVKQSIESLSISTTEEQWKFLHELSKKVFRFLKDKKKGGADQKENVVKWLKDKFNGSLESEEDTWENFKSLCEAQLKREPKDNNENENYLVNVEESRLCFMGSNESKKTQSLDDSKDFFSASYASYYGNLGLWDPMSFDNETGSYLNLGFQNLNKLNLDWWNDFINTKPSAKVDDKFDEWYNSSKLKNNLNVVQ